MAAKKKVVSKKRSFRSNVKDKRKALEEVGVKTIRKKKK